MAVSTSVTTPVPPLTSITSAYSPKSLPSSLSKTPFSPSALTNKELYRLCQLYGGNAKNWLRKFAGLLPEVFKRSLHLQHGCGSISEFAKKLSGMNERTTDKILNLHKRLANKPHLLALLESGEQGWSKLEKVAFIATNETEKDLAEKVKMLPKNALEFYVQSQREKLTPGSQAQNNSEILQAFQEQKPLGVAEATKLQNNLQDPKDPHSLQIRLEYAQNSLPVVSLSNEQPSLAHANRESTAFPETFTTISFPISAHSRQKLNLVKADLEKQYKKTLTWNEVIALWPIREMDRVSTPIIKICPKCAQAKVKTQATRPIPCAIRKLVLATHGRVCAFPGCTQAYAEFHHVKPYAIYKNHDPEFILPVCKTHHTLFHAGLIANAERESKFWSIRTHAQQTAVDKKAMRIKMRAA